MPELVFFYPACYLQQCCSAAGIIVRTIVYLFILTRIQTIAIFAPAQMIVMRTNNYSIKLMVVYVCSHIITNTICLFQLNTQVYRHPVPILCKRFVLIVLYIFRISLVRKERHGNVELFGLG